MKLACHVTNYIEEITFSSQIRVHTSHSVTLIKTGGQHPRTESPTVSKAEGISRPVSGRESRLVSIKWTGNVPKYI